jgi:hypothetical protein
MDTSIFVPNGASREQTAVLLVGTAKEHGLPRRSIRVAPGGFYITKELADLIGEDVAESGADGDGEGDVFIVGDHTIDEVKSFVEDNPELAAAVLAQEQAGKNRTTLVDWLATIIETSGNRAAKK